MSHLLLNQLNKDLLQLKDEGLYKEENQIISQQQPEIQLSDKTNVINFCANNYLGLANHPDLIKAARDGLSKYGFGLASVRFICGTQDIHTKLEDRISSFLYTDDTILYSSCFDANGGLFETLLDKPDAVISDELNHASIIDGIRLCKAKRFRYKNNDMNDLEDQLKSAKDCRNRLIVTDGVFSMDGTIANLSDICDLADKYDALVMVDDSHAVGFIGKNGRGTPEYCNAEGRVDIVTGTLGKALGGASGGYTSGRREIISWLRQRSRPYLFSNSLAPAIATASLKVIDMVRAGAALREKLKENSDYFRTGMTQMGFTLIEGDHPIIPVMLFEEKLAGRMAQELLKSQIYAVGFSYPVVPKGKARIRTQMSAAHTRKHLDKALEAFGNAGRRIGII